LTKYGISSEILAIISENMKNDNYVIERIGIIDAPIASSVALAKFAYPNQFTLIKSIEKLLKRRIVIARKFRIGIKYDQPNADFMGPF
jgi:pyruvate/2-oxoglutarate/acetoin dehydrogenase E1 component